MSSGDVLQALEQMRCDFTDGKRRLTSTAASCNRPWFPASDELAAEDVSADHHAREIAAQYWEEVLAIEKVLREAEEGGRALFESLTAEQQVGIGSRQRRKALEVWSAIAIPCRYANHRAFRISAGTWPICEPRIWSAPIHEFVAGAALETSRLRDIEEKFERQREIARALIGALVLILVLGGFMYCSQ